VRKTSGEARYQSGELAEAIKTCTIKNMHDNTRIVFVCEAFEGVTGTLRESIFCFGTLQVVSRRPVQWRVFRVEDEG
jgi:hypothetical protein